MMSSFQPAAVDTELLELVELVLRDSGYVVAPMSTEGAPYLLAEDQDSVVVAAAVVGVEDVFAAEPILSRALVGRLAESHSGAKKWDGYVIVVTSSRPDDTTTEALFSLTYNLHEVRRLVRVGVEATTAAVARSLRPVLPLSEAIAEATTIDPLTALERRLVADGLDFDQVALAVASFRAETGAQLGLNRDDGGDGVVTDDDSSTEPDLDGEDDDV